MAKKTFTPIIGDLESLTEKERVDYVLGACEFLGVPPELGVVGLRLMDSGDGKRNLVLYVQKGATDIIREKRGISVDSMDEVNGEGYVGWKVKGHNKDGRTEIAIGTVSIVNVGGKKAADSVMVAQTKSLRRMTLQFAGGGFLDISELDEKTTDIMNSAQSLQQIAAQPAVVPNTAAGKDVTEVVPKESEPRKAESEGTERVEKAAKLGDRLTVGQRTASAEMPTDSTSSVKRPRGRPRKVVSLDTPVSTNVETSNSVAQPVVEGHPNPVKPQEITEQKPGEVAEAPAQPEIPVSDISPKEVEGPSDGGTIPTPEQKTAYTKRLSNYVNEILPKAGFLQSEKLGGRNDQMKMFFKAMFPTANTKNLSIQQWDEFFGFMDGTVNDRGAKVLVQLIYEKIDPKKEAANG